MATDGVRPTIRPRLEELVADALSLDYVSTSCKDAVATGNHYQSVNFGGRETAGFRERRDEFLDQVVFTGKTVLDLGSNLGELSRGARARGAFLVDGFEFDPFFIEVGSVLNTLAGTTRVSFFQRDITDPAAFDEPYDVVLAFSVWHYVRRLVRELGSITRDLLVVETHRLDDNLDHHYVAPLSEHLPAYRILGYSRWKGADGQGGRRAVVAFARDEAQLDASLSSPTTGVSVDPGNEEQLASG
ncbi:MAG: class I SAM-dependent methyltransferase [Actinomycetota bacterium]|nr:class I SAM-dependent methyltransferase [Actinomycetota bacterium]